MGDAAALPDARTAHGAGRRQGAGVHPCVEAEGAQGCGAKRAGNGGGAAGHAAGRVRSAIQVVAPGKDYVGYSDSPGPKAGHSIPLVVTVRDLQLLESDVAYGMYTQTLRMGWLAPQSRMPYVEDLRRHGMNVAGQITGSVRGYVAPNGEQKLDFSAFDSRVAQVARFGMRSFFFYCGVPSNPYGAGVVSHETQMAIVNRCRQKGWPEPLFYVGDEPGGRGAEWAEEINRHYGAAAGPAHRHQRPRC